MKELTVTGHLSPYGVMTHPETLRIFSALAAHGGKARFVGGIVRDALLKRPLQDVDIACDLMPGDTVTALEKDGIRVIPTGLKHGTVTAMTEHHSYEITTLRIDVNSDGRHADVAFTDNWLADAKRRDFTFNALYCDMDGTLYDPFDGETDLRVGRVRFIGVAEDRIAEDYLRIMRFFRFHAFYGRPPLDPIGAEACRKGVAGLRDISVERIRDELFKLLSAKTPAATIGEMIGFGVLPVPLPDVRNVARLRLMEWLEGPALSDPAITIDPLRRLAALYVAPETPNGHEAAARFARHLRLSGDQAERFATMVLVWPLITADMDADAVRRSLYRLGADAFRDAVLLAWADRGSCPPRPVLGENARWQSLLDAARDWQPRPLPVMGRDILAAGLAPAGPQVGALLAQAETYWLDRAMMPDHAELMTFVADCAARIRQETE
ncbi:CCA tRNA nucleotidyltransferase [Thalassospira sp.]|uniref:CCA tRNA nucleotidyltransferase n=1 Tax=Thalassospira sp. TaxID=1912094 RepID=UPI0027359EB5|nr:CCA tRNA nucleotidyltransferase [Thalassospira sp.]MDP2696584.1 CCA tRNA nucleotidyltransferase [Thalassospira sp.]